MAGDLVMLVMGAVATVVVGSPQQARGAVAPPAVPVFTPGFTPEVQQARLNFQSAYNYLAELAHQAPDDPVTPVTGVNPPNPTQTVQGNTQRASLVAQQTPKPTPVPLPPGYQFGGLTPDVAQATAQFFRAYVSAANRANSATNAIRK